MQLPRFNLFLRVATLCALVMATGIAARGQTGFLYAASLRASSAPSNALALKDFPRASLVPGDVLPLALTLRTPFPDSKLRRLWTEQAALSETHVSPVSPDRGTLPRAEYTFPRPGSDSAFPRIRGTFAAWRFWE